ncbi:hypothetical protein ID866_8396 [Astraeus odoratus]|nr:hypothetical protein ID866_8396 [Astraeus odoratus]
MSPATVYRRQSMAQLYEKLQAQDDEDDMAWLAQFSPEDKADVGLYAPLLAPSPYLSSVSSTSTSSPSTGCTLVNTQDDDESSSSDSSDDVHSSDSGLETEPLTLNVNFNYPTYVQPSDPPLLFQSDGFLNVTELPYIPHIALNVQPQPNSAPQPNRYCRQVESPLVVPAPSPEPANHPVSVPHSATISPLMRPKRTLSANPASRTRRDVPEDQADTESDGDATDDEYIPSPSLNPRKRPRPTRIVVSEKPIKDTRCPPKRPRPTPPYRNTQAIPGTVPATQKNNPWACPYCTWIQRNRRTPDLKRHIRTHTRSERPAQWVCCGVPLNDAGKYKLPAGAEPYNWQGRTMIGGCGREFSRRDALKRHLDNEHITCIGDMNAFATCYDD